MLSSKFISPSIYNELSGINDNEVVHEDTLLALGQLFAAFQVEQLVGVGLLHKHFSLAQDNIMVHNGHTCKPEPIQTSAHATASSSSCDGTKSQTFEDGQGEPSNLPTDFHGCSAGRRKYYGACGGIWLPKRGCDPMTSFHPRQDGDPKAAVSHFNSPELS